MIVTWIDCIVLRYPVAAAAENKGDRSMDSKSDEKVEPAQGEGDGQPSESEPKCGCGATGGISSKVKLIACIVVALAAAALIAHGFMKSRKCGGAGPCGSNPAVAKQSSSCPSGGICKRPPAQE